MPEPLHDVVFLFDVDYTLLNKDIFDRDLSQQLEQELGREAQERYWVLYEEVRAERSYADYLESLQRLRLEHAEDPAMLQLSAFLLDYPFSGLVYPGAVEALARCGQLGPTVILSDGDAIFQPHKVRSSGLWEAVQGRVLIYVHKDKRLDDVQQRHPARHYVMVDDKQRILATMKQAWGARLTTVFPHQGHYADDPGQLGSAPPPDVTLEKIGDLATLDVGALLG